MPARPRTLPSGTVTFLFTDIEGSTRLADRLGKAWPGVLEAHRRTLRRAFVGHGGVEVGTEGDSFFVAFEGAGDAVAAAADAQRGLARRSWPEDIELRIRIGLHTGVGRVAGGDYVGLDVHRAARIAGAAHGGQVVLSDATRALIEHELPPGVGVRALGRYQLRDMRDSEELFGLVIPGLPADFPPLRSTERVLGNLPVPLTKFVGRAREVAELRKLLGSSRMVTLIGPAGTGKTRLAIEAARGVVQAFPDGAWFVPLEALVDPGQVPGSIAAALGVREVGKPTEAVLKDHFRPRRCLVVLDNFEHLLAAAPLATELLSAAPGLHVAATSQAELRLSGERLYPVPPLGVGAPSDAGATSEAATFFVDRATSALPGFKVSPEDARIIAQICARLDGLPLAIELAAARVRMLGLKEILARLDDRLALLSMGPSDVPDRHRTLRAAIAWSHELLGPSEATLFRRVAVFSGGATLAAIERTCAGDGVSDVLTALDELVRHSLVHVDSRAEGTRYGMLETVREFALERLAESGEASVIRRRHAEWFAELLETLAPRLRLHPFEAHLAEPEIENLESALEWAAQSVDAELGLRICGSSWRVWERRGRLREGLAWTQHFLALGSDDALLPHRIRALEAAGGIAYWLGDNEMAAAAYRERLALALRQGFGSEIADAHLDLMFALGNLGDSVAARSELEAARAAYEGTGDELGVARCRWNEASSIVMERRYGEGRRILEGLLEIFRQRGDVGYAGLTMGSLAMCCLAMGDLAAADTWFRQLVSLGESASLVAFVTALGSWSRLLGRFGDPRLGARLQGAYEALSETYGVQMSPRLADVIDMVLAESSQDEELDPDERDRLVEEGRGYTLQDAIEAVQRWAQEDRAEPSPTKSSPGSRGRRQLGTDAHARGSETT